jgi:hypothetical protein
VRRCRTPTAGPTTGDADRPATAPGRESGRRHRPPSRRPPQSQSADATTMLPATRCHHRPRSIDEVTQLNDSEPRPSSRRSKRKSIGHLGRVCDVRLSVVRRRQQPLDQIRNRHATLPPYCRRHRRDCPPHQPPEICCPGGDDSWMDRPTFASPIPRVSNFRSPIPTRAATLHSPCDRHGLDRACLDQRSAVDRSDRLTWPENLTLST